MKKDTTHIGLDAHKVTIHAAILLPGAEKAFEESVANTSDGVRRFVRRLKKRAPGEVVCCYEAGPLGYGLQRTLIRNLPTTLRHLGSGFSEHLLAVPLRFAAG